MSANSFRSGDWPCLYGPAGNCCSREQGYRLTADGGIEKAWSVTCGTGYSAPVVAGSKVVLLHRVGDKECVTCRDAAKGTVHWEQTGRTDFRCDYANYSSGPYSTPVIDDDLIYTQSAEGMLQALSMEDGELAWQRQLSDEYGVAKLGYGVSHSPLLVDDLLVVNLGGTRGSSAVVALRSETGETVWTSVKLQDYPRRASCTTPVAASIHGKTWIFVVTGESVVCLEPQNGREVWSIRFSTDSRDTPNSTTPIVVDDLLFVSMFRAGAFCLRIAADGSYSEVWNNRRTLESCYNPLTCVAGKVYGWHSFDRSLRCIDLATGKVHWKRRCIFGRANHIVVENHLVILGEQGHVGWVAANPDGYDCTYVTQQPVISGPCFSMPALSNGRLYIRNESELVCLKLPRTDDVLLSAANLR